MPFTSAASILVLSVLNPALPAVWARHQQHDAGWSAGGDENTAPTKRNFLLVARDLLHKAAAEGQARNSAHGSQAAKAWVIPPAEAVSEQSRLTATSRPVTMAHQPLWLHPDRLRQQQQQQQQKQVVAEAIATTMTRALSPAHSLPCTSSRAARHALTRTFIASLSPGHGRLITPRLQCFDLAADDVMAEGHGRLITPRLQCFDLAADDAMAEGEDEKKGGTRARIHGEHFTNYEDVAQNLQDAADALRSLINTSVITSYEPCRRSMAGGASHNVCSDRRPRAPANAQQVAGGKKHGRFIH